MCHCQWLCYTNHFHVPLTYVALDSCLDMALFSAIISQQEYSSQSLLYISPLTVFFSCNSVAAGGDLLVFGGLLPDENTAGSGAFKRQHKKVVCLRWHLFCVYSSPDVSDTPLPMLHVFKKHLYNSGV